MVIVIDTILRIPDFLRRRKHAPTTKRLPRANKSLATRTLPRNAARSEAPAMLMASRNIAPLVARIRKQLQECGRRSAERRLLMTLDDRALQDIGLSRCDAEREYDKPFWR